jgi:hypothetical protein
MRPDVLTVDQRRALLTLAGLREETENLELVLSQLTGLPELIVIDDDGSARLGHLGESFAIEIYRRRLA